VVNFGIFVTFNNLEGLVHISEIAWGHVNNPSDFGKLGDSLKVKVIGIDGEKISLSMKRLTPNPWEEISKEFEVGQVVDGKVNRVTDYGAFVTLADEINGLVHVSEIAEDDEVINMSENFSVGDKIKAKIINIDIDNHRIGLTTNLDAKVQKTADAAPAKEEKKPESLADLGVSDKIVSSLEEAGYKKVGDLSGVKEDKLTELDGVGPATAKKIMEQVV